MFSNFFLRALNFYHSIAVTDLEAILNLQNSPLQGPPDRDLARLGKSIPFTLSAQSLLAISGDNVVIRAP